jgi:acyl-CoA thioesterase FadM
VPLLQHQMSVTGTLTVRFVRPVPIGRPLEARAWVAEKLERKWRLSAELVLSSSGARLAEAEGVFVLRDRSTHFGGFEQWLSEQ